MIAAVSFICIMALVFSSDWNREPVRVGEVFVISRGVRYEMLSSCLYSFNGMAYMDCQRFRPEDMMDKLEPIPLGDDTRIMIEDIRHRSSAVVSGRDNGFEYIDIKHPDEPGDFVFLLEVSWENYMGHYVGNQYFARFSAE